MTSGISPYRRYIERLRANLSILRSFRLQHHFIMKMEQPTVSRIFRQLRPTSIRTWKAPTRTFHHSPFFTVQPLTASERQSILSGISLQKNQIRFQKSRLHSSAVPSTTSSKIDYSVQEPKYQVSFTCKPCGHRSTHRFSKHGYHKGTVLIQCPSCLVRHLFADHLKQFEDKSRTIEDMLREKGQSVTRGKLNGDMEFWDDGTVVSAAKP